MKVQVNFKIINSEYNQKYANEFHAGKESESNWKYKWAVAYEIKKAKSVSIIENEDFSLKGKFEDHTTFDFKIPNVMIYRCHMDDGQHTDFAVSKSILNKIHEARKEGYDVTRFYFYLNAAPKSVQLSNNLVVDEKDVPKELIKQKI